METVTPYDEDIYAWSQQQAAALRRLAETRRDLPNELDLEHVAEEIQDLGRSELRTVESFIELLLRHLLKVVSAPQAPAVPHWTEEIEVQHRALATDLKNSMRQLIDLDHAWKAARARAGASLLKHGDALVAGLPAPCPFSLEDLAAEPFDIEGALEKVRESAAPAS